MRRYWREFRRPEFIGLDPEKAIAILPTAAIEQHGPHLPVGVDAMINEGMLAEVVAQAPDDLDFRILPVQAVGKSNEHIDAPGTLTLTAETALRAWVEIGRSVARAGIRKMVIVNSHGGNLDLISIVSRELRVELGMLCAKCQWGSFGHPEGMYPAQELTYGIHGGDVETSLMLNFHPELVDMTAARNFRSAAEGMANMAHLRPTGSTSFGWMASDLNADGTVGDASVATAEKGRATARHQAAGFLRLLRDVESFDLSRLGQGADPWGL